MQRKTTIWEQHHSAHAWTPGSGVPAPWVGKGIATGVKNFKQKREPGNSGESSAKLKALTKALEELQDSVDHATSHAERLETVSVKLSDKIKAMAVLLDHTKGNSEEATALAREALTQVAAAVADSGSLQKIFGTVSPPSFLSLSDLATGMVAVSIPPLHPHTLLRSLGVSSVCVFFCASFIR